MTISTVAALREALEVIEGALGAVRSPLGIVLGSGLGGLADQIEAPRTLSYNKIPHLAASTVEGHAGQLVAGRWQGHEVVMLSGRVHSYEGHSFAQVALPVQLLAAMGVETLIVTNAAGATNPDFGVGDLMVLRDHINLMGANPLTGTNDKRLGPRFPDMTMAYNEELRWLAMSTATKMNLRIHQGVYAGVLGPSYETPAEVRMIRMLGGDAIGMSTIPEVIAARHAGMRVLGMSCLTNMAAGLGGSVLSHDHVAEVAGKATEMMSDLLAQIVSSLPPLKLREDYIAKIRGSQA